MDTRVRHKHTKARDKIFQEIFWGGEGRALSMDSFQVEK